MSYSASIVTQIGLFTAFFASILVVLRKSLPVPPVILAQKEKLSPFAYRTMRWEYLSNFGALTHAVLTTALSFYILFLTDIKPESQNPPILIFTMCLSVGYFIVDTIGGILFKYNDNLMLLHHILALCIPLNFLTRCCYGEGYMWVLLIGEFTNPFLIIRKNLEKNNASKFITNTLGLVFAISFIIMRGVIANPILVKIMRYPISLSSKICIALLWYFSLYWCYTIVNYLVKGLKTELGWQFLEPVQKRLNSLRASKIQTLIMHLTMLTVSFSYVIAND